MTWTSNVSHLRKNLDSLSIRDSSQRKIDADLAFSMWKQKTMKIRRKQNRIYLVGNGASASMASHIAADLAKNAGLQTEVFTDLSLVTAIANDCGYVEVFTEALRWKMRSEDMLVAISSSGESPNVLSSVKFATSIGGYVVTISAMNANNSLRFCGQLNFHVPSMTYGSAETCHAAILHHWVDHATESTNQLNFENRNTDFQQVTML